MEPDLWSLYRQMLRSRRFETAIIDLWAQGSISGEMHLGVGEEAIAVGVVAHLRDGDALSLDHRGTPPLVARGVDLVLILRELLGQESGLCGGQGGHMHLFSREHLAASSGIVGAACPAAVGFALANRQLRPGAIAVAFFGEGAMNQGMVMEALNLAAAWTLPLVVICKDNDWAITTESHAVTGGDLADRARALGVPAESVDGTDPEAVHSALARLVPDVRDGAGPRFLLAGCPRLDGHMAGFIMDRLAHSPIRQGTALLGRVAAAATARGGGLREKASSLGDMARTLKRARTDHRDNSEDPLRTVARRLEPDDVEAALEAATEEMEQVREAAMAPEAGT